MFNIFKNMDFISQKPEILFNGKDRFKTNYGGLLSLLIIFIALAAASYFIYTFVGNTNPIINGSKFYTAKALRNFNRSNIFVMMELYDGLGKPFDNVQSIITPMAFQWDWIKVPDPDNPGKNKSLTKLREVKMTTCNEKYMKTYYKDITKMIEITDYAFCLAPDFNFTVMNPYGVIDEFSYINMYFTFCNNKTEALKGSGIVCKPIEEIKKLTGSYTWRAAHLDYYLDHDNFTSPLQPFINTVVIQGGSEKYTKLNTFFQNTYYDTDVGWLMEEIKKDTSFNFVRYDLITDSRVPVFPTKETFFQVTIANLPNGFHERYMRKYKKIQNIMADIGGFTNVLIILGTIIATIFSQVEYWQIIQNNCALLVSADTSNETENMISIIQTTSKMSGNLPNNSHDYVVELNNKKTEDVLKLKDNIMKKDEAKLSSDYQIIKKEDGNVLNIPNSQKLKNYENLKKIAETTKFIRPSYKNQFCVLLCCCKKSENDTLVEGLNSYHKHVLDVRTVIKLHNDMKLLKNLLMTAGQRKFFDVLSNMKNSKELSLYEDEEKYEEKKGKERNESEILMKGITLLDNTLYEDLTEKLLDKFSKKIMDHHEAVKRKRTSTILN